MLRRKPIVQECEITDVQFEISAEQREAYDFFDIPLPTVCPAERLRHQLVFSSASQFYWRRCAHTNNKILSCYPPTSPFPVLDPEFWRSEEWDPYAYGRAYDFKQLFVDQLFSLWTEVPRPAVSALQSDSSNGVHDVIDAQDCAMLLRSAHNVGCMHSSQLFHSRLCLDCHFLLDCEACYSSVHLQSCKRLYWSEACVSCSDSYFLANCQNCSNCLFCANLKGAKYCIFNKQYDQESYERILAEWNLGSQDSVTLARRAFHGFLQEYAVPNILSDKPSSTTGNYLQKCDRMSNSFECCQCDNCADCNFLFEARDCLEGCALGIDTESCAQFVGVGASARSVVNSIACYDNVENLEYCSHCERSSNLFACVGMRNAEYCIFNKQYSKEEYEKLRLSIVALLKDRDIWGRFLPARFSPFEYNRSLAQVIMPLAKVPAQLLGFRWNSSDTLIRPSQLKSRMGNEYQLALPPSHFESLEKRAAAREVFLCELTGRPYSITTQERELYRELRVAPPARCPEQRFESRLNDLAPRVLEEREEMLTSFPADWYRPVVPQSQWKKGVTKAKR